VYPQSKPERFSLSLITNSKRMNQMKFAFVPTQQTSNISPAIGFQVLLKTIFNILNSLKFKIVGSIFQAEK
jgi:hypothetical protein